ncbi:MAG: hypothetical protein CMJ73_05180 [Planctomycetaceae bacterium]|nr:hypothetical protein [Planctomycetaceae bacterium]
MACQGSERSCSQSNRFSRAATELELSQSHQSPVVIIPDLLARPRRRQLIPVAKPGELEIGSFSSTTRQISIVFLRRGQTSGNKRFKLKAGFSAQE